jgi:RNA polymerase sigma-70 factor (ECF subfamily)
VSSSPAPFEALVAEVYAPLQRYLRRRADATTAEDVLGDVLLVLWRRFDDVPPEASLAWCYGVARGCLANAVRSSQRQLRLVRRIAREPVPVAADDDPVLAEALAALPEGDREVLRLWAWEQLAPAEIAVVLGVTPNAASIRLHRAKTRLKKELLARQERSPAGHPGGRQGEEAS